MVNYRNKRVYPYQIPGSFTYFSLPQRVEHPPIVQLAVHKLAAPLDSFTVNVQAFSVHSASQHGWCQSTSHWTSRNFLISLNDLPVVSPLAVVGSPIRPAVHAVPVEVVARERSLIHGTSRESVPTTAVHLVVGPFAIVQFWSTLVLPLPVALNSAALVRPVLADCNQGQGKMNKAKSLLRNGLTHCKWSRH